MLTARGLVEIGLPQLPLRTSPRSSTSCTQPTCPRTFENIEEWPDWEAQVQALVESLDNNNAIHRDCRADFDMDDPVTDEGDIRAMLRFLFPKINRVASVELNLEMKYVTGGSGRSLSFTDALIMSNTAPLQAPPQAPDVATGRGRRRGRGRNRGRGARAGTAGGGAGTGPVGGGGGAGPAAGGGGAGPAAGGGGAGPAAGGIGTFLTKDLSERVFATIELKGNWQFDLEHGESLLEAFHNSDVGRREKLMGCTQQLYGDMVMEEVGYGILTTYDKSVFFRRSADVNQKTLQVSPTVYSSSAPIKYFLFFLHEVETKSMMKRQLPRARVPVTPPSGYLLVLPITNVIVTSRGRQSRAPPRALQVRSSSSSSTKRKRSTYVDMDLQRVTLNPDMDVQELRTYDISALGLTGNVIGLGGFGNILESVVQGFLLALKTYDTRKAGAVQAFSRELKAYDMLKSVQGHACPMVYGIGQVVHCCWPFIALSYEGKTLADSENLPQNVKTKAVKCLLSIHGCGVLHNDISLKNMVLTEEGWIMFVDFGRAVMDADAYAMDSEVARLEELLDNVSVLGS